MRPPLTGAGKVITQGYPWANFGLSVTRRIVVTGCSHHSSSSSVIEMGQADRIDFLGACDTVAASQKMQLFYSGHNTDIDS
ncbi:hypothetical protein [Sphingobacterium suaedae]|uniref:Uncharacterized protein n=1 Tax=Sphingobacterium suaedae TaxID=1686402 RepID=A0ABW5KJX5_9SPHI